MKLHTIFRTLMDSNNNIHPIEINSLDVVTNNSGLIRGGGGGKGFDAGIEALKKLIMRQQKQHERVVRLVRVALCKALLTLHGHLAQWEHRARRHRIEGKASWVGLSRVHCWLRSLNWARPAACAGCTTQTR